MPETLRIDNAGAGLHVEVDGPPDATPVVLLHGVTSSARTWEWLPDELTGGRRLVRIDFRGHGRSEHTPGRYGVDDYGSDVVAVLRELGGPPAVLVGHSLGGVVAWWVAQSHPELVAAAFLEDPPLLASETPDEDAGRFREIFKLLRANVLGFREAGLTDEQVAERMAAAPFGPPGSPLFGELVHEDAVAAMAFGHNRLDVGVIDGAIDGSTLAATDTRSPVTPPVTILAADDAFGAAFSTRDAERLAQTHPQVEVVRVSGSGHGIHDERLHRAAFVDSLRGFLDRHAPVG